MVSAVDMAKKYGDFIALHPLNVEVHAGEFFGVFGPNGAGKSTFIKLLTGQLRPSKGRIEVLGVDAVKDPQKVKANIGIVPESESPPSFLTPAEFLEFVARLRGVEDMKAAGEVIRALGAAAVLVKGGHLEDETLTDVLVTSDGVELFHDQRIDTKHTHGTGCTLASSLAAGLAAGMGMTEAVQRARGYVRAAILAAPGFGSGHGPMDHGHPLRRV